MKNGVSGGNGFAIGDANIKNCPLKCPIFQTNETFKTDKSKSKQMEAHVFKNFFLR